MLDDERARLQRFLVEGAELAERLPPRLRRHLSHTEAPLGEAVRTRLAVIADERDRMPERLAAAEEHVLEAEREHDELRQA